MHTVIVQHLAGKLATKHIVQVTKMIAILADIPIYRIVNCHRHVRSFRSRQMVWRIDVLHFYDISDTELSAASQAFEDSCVKELTANLNNVPNGEFSDISDCELQSALHTYENNECFFVPRVKFDLPGAFNHHK